MLEDFGEEDDEEEFEIVKTLELSKYKNIKQWYENYDNRDFKKYLRVNVYGIDTDFGWGGLHSARKKYKAEDYTAGRWQIQDSVTF